MRTDTLIIGGGLSGLSLATQLVDQGQEVLVVEARSRLGGRILTEIQNGQFARDWLLENRAGQPSFHATRRRERTHSIEQVGKDLRRMMSWIDSKEV